MMFHVSHFMLHFACLMACCFVSCFTACLTRHILSFMSYRVEASTIAEIVGMRLQERSMKADADHGNLIHVSNHVSFTSYRLCQTCMMTLLECVHRNMKADTDQGNMNRYSGVMRVLKHAWCLASCHASCFGSMHHVSSHASCRVSCCASFFMSCSHHVFCFMFYASVFTPEAYHIIDRGLRGACLTHVFVDDAHRLMLWTCMGVYW